MARGGATEANAPMGSKKRSAKAKQIAEFKSQLGDMGDLFAREDERREELAERRESARRERACESKNRYASRAEAEGAIASCAEWGRRGLSCYRCEYCGGWHLTSHPHR